jgi:hypothetical protein
MEEVFGAEAYAPAALAARREAVVDLLLYGVLARGKEERS